MLMECKFWYIWLVLEIIILSSMFSLYFLVDHPEAQEKDEILLDVTNSEIMDYRTPVYFWEICRAEVYYDIDGYPYLEPMPSNQGMWVLCVMLVNDTNMTITQPYFLSKEDARESAHKRFKNYFL